jgi:hypothetical protein
MTARMQGRSAVVGAKILQCFQRQRPLDAAQPKSQSKGAPVMDYRSAL